MNANKLREKYLKFFESKKHAIIPSAPIVPENDPTALFNTSGMQPLIPYLMGEKHPKGTRLTNSQKCIRTIDIDEVGDTTHHTFFEMLGNWSLGDYFKKEAIEWSWEFMTSPEWLGLDKNRLAVSVFVGDEDAPFDEESFEIWKKLGMSESRIAKLPKENNWWGPVGETGPCGPDTEMFYWVGDPNEVPDSFNDDNDSWVEIWNDVFMAYNKKQDGTYEKLTQQNVDTGMGLMRVLTALNGLDDNYKTDLFWPIISRIEEISKHRYDEDEDKNRIKFSMRIIADHIKASVFMIADGVLPSNTERGYILRRLIRRAVRQGHILGLKDNFTVEIAKVVQDLYKETYPEVLNKNILIELQKEEENFRKTLEKGLKEFEKIKEVNGIIAFDLFQTYGFPVEMFFEELKNKEIIFNENEIKNEFDEKLKKHQELSRTASAGMFKGGLADTKEETMQLHTVAHLMLAGLRKILGEHVHQKGSNINGERVRFDFSHPEKMTNEQKKEVEDYVNEAIEERIDVQMKEMSLNEAKEKGAEGAFENKYGDFVKVFSIKGFSREICGGPHVKNTGDIKGKFKIKKEESSSAGIRRIKAVLE
jgi:alanyl-tRNA synthetase